MSASPAHRGSTAPHGLHTLRRQRDAREITPAEGAMMAVERIEHRQYLSFGECIFCGVSASDVELTDEHIVAFSLGGNAVILKASCKRCAAETSKLEHELGRKVYCDFRAHVNAPTRRKKERPTELPFTFSIAGGERQTKTVPIGEHPYFTAMPVWGLPGLFEGRPIDAPFQEHKAHIFYWIPPNIKKILALDDGVVAEIPFPDFCIDHHRFARAIAKIAYCQAVAQFGLDRCRTSVLRDVILGKNPNVPYYVGCKLEEPPPPADRNVLHAIQIATQWARGRLFLVATVRLFANSGVEMHGSPIYEVVIGELSLPDDAPTE
jgi:HNH endonuclease